jgi:hypothetical protein
MTEEERQMKTWIFLDREKIDISWGILEKDLAEKLW